LAIVDEHGTPIGEEYTLALAMRHYLGTRTNKQGGLVIANLSTSKMFDDVAHEFGCKILRTQIGEIHVASALVEEDAVFGGEGNGGVIWPEVGYVRDSISGMALILELLATSGKTISQLVTEIPKYEIVKDKIEVSSREEVEAYLQKTKDIFADENLDLIDGVKVNFENGWLHVRASNTEPIVRFFAEAPTIAQAESWIKAIKDPAPTL
jgi:phosphomannomutase